MERTDASSDNSETVEAFAKHVHLYIREHISAADRKAAFIFTVGAGLLAFLNQSGATWLWLKQPNKWGAAEVLAFLSLLFVGSGIVSAIAVVIPNLRRGAGRGYIFWESILEFKTSAGYASSIKLARSEDLTEAMLEHCYVLAYVCNRKHSILNFSILAGAVGLGLSVLLLGITS